MEAEPLQYRHDQRPLTFWFHTLGPAEGEPRDRCAYCEGPLGETGRRTIDHFLPVFRFPTLALAWANLLPACDSCNSTYKGSQWSCHLLRPDEDAVESFFVLDVETGTLDPNPSLCGRDRARARLTARVFGLNKPPRCAARVRVLRDLRNAMKAMDRATLEEHATQGPYRFVGRWFLRSLPD
jgi:uncharacterized protein (TIGR02646 family)